MYRLSPVFLLHSTLISHQGERERESEFSCLIAPPTSKGSAMDYPSADEMDLDDEWEILEDEGFVVSGREFVSRDVGLHDKSLLVDVNYFLCPPSPPPPPPRRDLLIEGSEEGIKDVDVIPPWLEPKIEKNLEEEEEEKEIPVFSINLQKEIFLQEPGTLPKFVEMKPAVLPEIFHGGAAPSEERSVNFDEFASVPKLVVAKKNEGTSLMGTLAQREKSHESGFTIWRWRIEGIGALCAFGRTVAATAAAATAATICVVVLGGNQRQRQHQQQRQQMMQNQKIRFHVYADDSRIKEILHHAGRLNQTLSVARGIPITGAQISFRS